tara:strand:- start:301 stop:786 length:486 start_codon:yes stop_codon:yes gene_type:complete
VICFKDNFLYPSYFKNLKEIILQHPLHPSFNGRQENIGFRVDFKSTDSLFKEFISTIEKNFPLTKKLKIHQNRISLHLRHNHEKPLPHLDDDKTKYNLIFYLKGDLLINNGTGFYNNNELTAHISFVENRAIFFKGNEIWHTNLQSFGASSPRYTLLIFYE